LPYLRIVNETLKLPQHGVSVNVSDNDGFTALHFACEFGSSDTVTVIEMLLANGADVNKRTNDGRTALDIVAECGRVRCAKVLIAAGADVHAINDVGDTMLNTSAALGYVVPLICLLIKAGVNLHAVNHKGKTAAQLAHDAGHKLIEQVLNRAAQQGH
jgi:ankyrin repeat domain-containing protein 50